MTTDPADGIEVRWNADGWALAADGATTERGRWEYWIDDDLVLWWSQSDRDAFHHQREGGL